MPKVVLVTGSAKGLGAEIVRKFASNGYNVIINYNESYDAAKKLEEEIKNNYNVETLCIKANITIDSEIDNMINIINDKFGKVDVLVNNAAISNDSLIDEKNRESFLKIIDVNLISAFVVTTKVKKIMNKGSIINISSTNSLDTYYPYSIDYDASKAGLNSITHNFAKEYAPNIRVNAIACGWIDTDMNKNMDPEYRESEENKSLLKRFANPSEIANVVYFVASDEASYINNEIIRVDGGYNG